MRRLSPSRAQNDAMLSLWCRFYSDAEKAPTVPSIMVMRIAPRLTA